VFRVQRFRVQRFRVQRFRGSGFRGSGFWVQSIKAQGKRSRRIDAGYLVLNV
jgi:hypothetical protein